MTGEWAPADWTPIVDKRRRALLRSGLAQFLVPAGLLVTRAVSGRSLLEFGVVIFLFNGGLYALTLRPLCSGRARARWEAQVMDEEVLDHAVTTREPVGQELHERVRERARELDSGAVLTATLGPLVVLLAVVLSWPIWSTWLPGRIAGVLAAGVLAAGIVVVSTRAARPARRWLADPPPPFVPDDAAHHD